MILSRSQQTNFCIPEQGLPLGMHCGGGPALVSSAGWVAAPAPRASTRSAALPNVHSAAERSGRDMHLEMQGTIRPASDHILDILEDRGAARDLEGLSPLFCCRYSSCPDRCDCGEAGGARAGGDHEHCARGEVVSLGAASRGAAEPRCEDGRRPVPLGKRALERDVPMYCAILIPPPACAISTCSLCDCRYYSTTTGNTETVAGYIAEATGLDAVPGC